MKLWERVIERRLRENTNRSKNQFNFMLGRSTAEAIHLLGRFIEFYSDRKKDLYMVSIYLEKVYNRVPRRVLWKCLENKDVSVPYSY